MAVRWAVEPPRKEKNGSRLGEKAMQPIGVEISRDRG